jgi:hypothetical protein
LSYPVQKLFFDEFRFRSPGLLVFSEHFEMTDCQLIKNGERPGQRTEDRRQKTEKQMIKGVTKRKPLKPNPCPGRTARGKPARASLRRFGGSQRRTCMLATTTITRLLRLFKEKRGGQYQRSEVRRQRTEDRGQKLGG